MVPPYQDTQTRSWTECNTRKDNRHSQESSATLALSMAAIQAGGEGETKDMKTPLLPSLCTEHCLPRVIPLRTCCLLSREGGLQLSHANVPTLYMPPTIPLLEYPVWFRVRWGGGEFIGFCNSRQLGQEDVGQSHL